MRISLEPKLFFFQPDQHYANCPAVKTDKTKAIYSPDNVWRHCPVRISQIFTVESAFPDTKMLSRNSIPEVRLWIKIIIFAIESQWRYEKTRLSGSRISIITWCPMRACLQAPDSTSQTLMEVSKDPDTTWTPSNWKYATMKTGHPRHSGKRWLHCLKTTKYVIVPRHPSLSNELCLYNVCLKEEFHCGKLDWGRIDKNSCWHDSAAAALLPSWYGIHSC